MLAAVFIAWQAESQALYIAAVVITIVSTFRVTIAYMFEDRSRRGDAEAFETLYEAGAWAYALSLGMVTALAVAFADDPTLHVLASTNAIGYAAGISGRNAGRPVIAIGQIILTTLPPALALWFSGIVSYKILAITIVLFDTAMIGITINTFAIVRDSFDAAEQNAELAEKMRSYARTDIVTGLLNRAGLNGQLVKLLAKNENDAAISVFWLDLDRFKEVNDTLGHPVGDRLLAETAKRLRRICPEDIVARFGGDEFVVVSSKTERSTIEAMAEDILTELTRPLRLDGHRLEIGVSIGIAQMPENGTDLDGVMQCADLALYHSKVNGRNQYSFFAKSMNRDLVRRREIETELRAAIQKNELSLYYQPIVDLKTGRIKAFEALVRWFHPEKGELEPTEFIPVAEDTGLIITLGNWITARACEAATQWPEDIAVCVNVSPVQMTAPGAALGILRAIRDAGIAPQRLELEITETVFIDEDAAISDFMDTLSLEGIRIALDDFGTGYSSLSYLHSYNFSKIKVDRSFVSGPNAGAKSNAIIRAVAELASTLDMTIVAEGIENPDHARSVQQAGCTQGQGYYYSRPVPETQALKLASLGRTAALDIDWETTAYPLPARS
ncbi:MAG: EAL domain-containing protein [Pseudomonadota bacterium]